MLEFLIAAVFAAEVQATELPHSEIPIQVSIEDDAKYPAFREKAQGYLLNDYSNECAKFVNRIFLMRFGKAIFGDAWNLQLKESNRRFLKLVWKLQESDFVRHKFLGLHKKEDRIEHFRKLYSVLGAQEVPIGVLGFVYRYSFYRDLVASTPRALPQTHVAFLAGKKRFYFENESEEARFLEDVLVRKYGVIHDFERPFLWTKIPLRKVMQPGERFYYDDYLVEEQFKTVRAGSLLELFLRKHRNNRITALLRPVSFSRISDSLIAELKFQEKLVQSLGEVEYVSGTDFDEQFKTESEKESWLLRLRARFGIRSPEKVMWVPVPVSINNEQLVMNN